MNDQAITSIAQLNELIAANQTISFINFYSPTCGPCMMLKPILDELVQINQINLFRVNVLEHPEIARAFNVNQWPTNFIYQKQKLV